MLFKLSSDTRANKQQMKPSWHLLITPMAIWTCWISKCDKRWALDFNTLKQFLKVPCQSARLQCLLLRLNWIAFLSLYHLKMAGEGIFLLRIMPRTRWLVRFVGSCDWTLFFLHISVMLRSTFLSPHSLWKAKGSLPCRLDHVTWSLPAAEACKWDVIHQLLATLRCDTLSGYLKANPISMFGRTKVKSTQGKQFQRIAINAPRRDLQPLWNSSPFISGVDVHLFW